MSSSGTHLQKGEGCRYSGTLHLGSQKSKLLLCFQEALSVQSCNSMRMCSQPASASACQVLLPFTKCSGDPMWPFCRGQTCKRGNLASSMGFLAIRQAACELQQEAPAKAVCGSGCQLAVQRQCIGRIGCFLYLERQRRMVSTRVGDLCCMAGSDLRGSSNAVHAILPASREGYGDWALLLWSVILVTQMEARHLGVLQWRSLIDRTASSAPGTTRALEGTTMRTGSQRAQRTQHRLLHLCLNVPVVLHIGVPVHNDFHDGVLVERPGCPERAAQALPLVHPLVRNAVRTAHACMCAQPWSGSCRLG